MCLLLWGSGRAGLRGEVKRVGGKVGSLGHHF